MFDETNFKSHVRWGTPEGSTNKAERESVQDLPLPEAAADVKAYCSGVMEALGYPEDKDDDTAFLVTQLFECLTYYVVDWTTYKRDRTLAGIIKLCNISRNAPDGFIRPWDFKSGLDLIFDEIEYGTRLKVPEGTRETKAYPSPLKRRSDGIMPRNCKKADGSCGLYPWEDAALGLYRKLKVLCPLGLANLAGTLSSVLAPVVSRIDYKAAQEKLDMQRGAVNLASSIYCEFGSLNEEETIEAIRLHCGDALSFWSMADNKYSAFEAIKNIYKDDPSKLKQIETYFDAYAFKNDEDYADEAFEGFLEDDEE